MKAALITEEQIKEIQDALELAHNEIHDPTMWTDKVDFAFTIIQSLKVMDHDAVDSAWNNLNKAMSDGPTSPFPEMASRFESYYGQSWTDTDWRKETSIWAAAWKEAIAYQKRHGLIDLPKQSTCTNSQTEQVQDGYAVVPINPTKVMLDAMDGCSREGYGEPLYAGHAASVYYAAINAASLSTRQDPENESRSKQEAIAWIPEDELPDSYPYDLMYQYSKIDMIRLFPVYEPSQHSDCEIKS